MRNSGNGRYFFFVGLGGTGVLISRWLEYYIRELLNEVPPWIRFLNLDTDCPEEGGPPEPSTSQFINLLDVKDFGEVVRDYAAHPELHPHLDWLKGLRLDAPIANNGAQGIPRLGRLVFAELRESVIRKAVRNCLSTLRDQCESTMAVPAVHILSSVCGGTGAGMLIDMAYNIRWWSRESFHRNAQIVGHLMLPEAFMVNTTVQRKLEANAGATLEQIEFLTDARRGDVPVSYREVRDGQSCFDNLTAPFDFIYLINGHGGTSRGNRKYLVRMIARAVRTMAVEPSAQHVWSDASNETNDALDLLEDANGRRRCFASYGFGFGIPGHGLADVDSWMRSALQAMNSGPSPGYTDYAAEVKGELNLHLDVYPHVGDIGKHTAPFPWRVPGLQTDEDVKTDVLDNLEKYVAGTLVPAVRARADTILSPNKANKELLGAADRMIEHDVFQASPLAPFGQVGVCLSQWEHQLDRWVKENSSPETIFNTVIHAMLDDAAQGLETLASRLPSRAWTPDDVIPIINGTISRYSPSLAEPILRENRLQSAKETLKVFRLRKQALKSVGSLASGACLPDTATRSQSHSANEEDYFSIPVYAASNPTTDLDGSLTRRLREDLIEPILRELVLSTQAATIKVANERLGALVSALRPQRQDFLEAAMSQNFSEFHSVPSSKEVFRHKYYPFVRDLWHFAEPKIGLSSAGVFAETLDVDICQHVAGTCVPALLAEADDLDSSFREANVDAAYEGKANVWLQLLRLRYGFCLPAISTYRDYAAATRDYVSGRGFRYADMWLDGRWYSSYKDALRQWAKDKGGRGKFDEIERSTYDAVAEQIGKVRRVTQGILEVVRKAIRSMSEVDSAVEAEGKRKNIEFEGKSILDNLSPDDEYDAVQKGLGQCLGQVEHLLNQLGAMMMRLPERDRVALEGALNECGQVLAAHRESPTPIEKVCGLMRRSFGFLRNHLESVKEMTEVDNNAMAGLKRIESELTDIQKSIDLSDSATVRQVSSRCFEPYKTLLDELQSQSAESTEPEEMKELRNTLERCRQEYAEALRIVGLTKNEDDSDAIAD